MNHKYIPKGYRRLRVGERYPIEYYYNRKSDIRYLNSQLITNWILVRNKNNEFYIDRLRNNSNYYILVKK